MIFKVKYIPIKKKIEAFPSDDESNIMGCNNSFTVHLKDKVSNVYATLFICVHQKQSNLRRSLKYTLLSVIVQRERVTSTDFKFFARSNHTYD